MTDPAIRCDELEGGALWHVHLARPKANILDAQMTGELSELFERAGATPGLKGILLEGEGPHFSFGASVQEHTKDRVAEMLAGFHGLFRRIAASHVTTLAAVRGQCLGGGLELAAFAHRLVAATDAQFGQPEIVLGVIAPVASLLLPHRCSRGAAENLLLSGRSIDATEALRIGLADQLANDPADAALDFAREYLLPRSASSLRFAVRAARQDFLERFFNGLDRLERLYIDELAETHDGNEGIAAFLDKRTPEWRDS